MSNPCDHKLHTISLNEVRPRCSRPCIIWACKKCNLQVPIYSSIGAGKILDPTKRCDHELHNLKYTIERYSQWDCQRCNSGPHCTVWKCTSCNLSVRLPCTNPRNRNPPVDFAFGGFWCMRISHKEQKCQSISNERKMPTPEQWDRYLEICIPQASRKEFLVYVTPGFEMKPSMVGMNPLASMVGFMR